MDILETRPGEVRLFTDDPLGFKIFDFQNSTVEIVNPPNTSADVLGPPVKGVLLADVFAICYKSTLILFDSFLNTNLIFSHQHSH